MPQISALFIIVIMLGGCGDIYTKEEAAPPPPAVNSGVHMGALVDGTVTGVHYVASPSNITGYTDRQGTFYYYPNDTIKFTIGDVLLGADTLKIKAQAMITPLTLTNANSIMNPTATNIARFIQTLDSDQNLSNGIVITQATHDLAVDKHVDFGQHVDIFGTAADTQTILNGRTILDVNSSREHLKTTTEVDFDNARLSGNTFTALWKLGGEYGIYKFSTTLTGRVDIQEEARYINKQVDLQASWSVDATTGLVTISRITDPTTGALYANRTLDLLAVTNNDIYLVKNSDVFKDFGVMSKATQTFSTSDLDGHSFALLSPSGAYAIFNEFNATTNNVQADFSEEYNVTLPWSIVGGKVQVTGTVNGVVRTDTIEALVNQGEIYKAKHTLIKDGTTLHTDEMSTFVGDKIPFFSTMLPGTYYCVTNKGLYYTLTLNSNGTGSVHYQKDNTKTPDGIPSDYTGPITRWYVDAANNLQITAIYNGSTQTNVTIIKKLRAVNEGMYLVENTSPFFTSTPKEYAIMYKAQPKKTVAQISGTYTITRDSYDSTTAKMTTATSAERSKIHFDNNQTGYYITASGTKDINFSWTIDSQGRISLYDSVNLTSSLLTFMYNYRDTIKVSERYQSAANDTNSNVYQYFYTYVKQP